MFVSRNEWRRHDTEMEPQAGRRVSPFRVTKRSSHFLRKNTRRSRVHVQTTGLNAETKKVPAASRRRDLSLDISFYRTFPISPAGSVLTPISRTFLSWEVHCIRGRVSRKWKRRLRCFLVEFQARFFHLSRSISDD